MRCLAAAAALWSCAALADGAASPAYDTAPKAIGAHGCLREMDDVATAMMARGERGVRAVKLDFHVAADGTVKDLAVAVSSEDALADEQALSCVQAWHYEPALKDGKPVEIVWEALVSLSSDVSSTRAMSNPMRWPRTRRCSPAKTCPPPSWKRTGSA